MSTFLWPYSFLFFLLPFFVWFFLPPVKGEQGVAALRVPFYNRVKSFTSSLGKNTSFLLRFLLALSWIFFVLAAARPVWFDSQIQMPREARNIVLAVDVSGSMQEQDFDVQGRAVSRMALVKAVVADFLAKRKQDNIGLVLFGTEAYTYAPLSFDNKTLQELLKEANVGVAGEMTAIGDGLAVSVYNAAQVPAKSRIVILLSDGTSNAGSVSVQNALTFAQKQGVKVYTIGVGSQSRFVQDAFGFMLANPDSSLDEETLSEIAKQTGGRYFRAKSTTDLQEIYQIIDKLETDTQKELTIRPQKELFWFPLLAGLLLLAFVWMKRGRV